MLLVGHKDMFPIGNMQRKEEVFLRREVYFVLLIRVRILQVVKIVFNIGLNTIL